MENNAVFNASVCLIGFVILVVHIANLLMKKKRRKDEKALFAFLVFTALHFAVYFAFTFIRASVKSDALITGFYTGFYIANNIEVLLLFIYMLSYVDLNKKKADILHLLNIGLFLIFVILDIVNAFLPMFFYAEGGEYFRMPLMFLSQGYQFVMLAIVFFVAVLNKQLKTREKAAFVVYCLLPVVAIIFQNFFKGYAIAYLSIIVATEVLFFFLNVERNIQLAKEEEMLKDAQIRVMLSQIQPHFIYNSLSSISTLITLDPDKAQQALDDFTEYLRINLSTLTETHLISFENELRHIELFVSLEQIRFGDRLKVIYDIQVSDFYLPTLTIQPLVENAIRHGILQKVEGGTLTLKTYETDKHYVVEVIDDGVGFDMKDVDFESNEHFGLNNIRYRMQRMGKGDLEIESELGVGTKITARFVK